MEILNGSLDTFANYTFLGNTIQLWATSLAIFIGLGIFFRISRILILKHLKHLAKKTSPDIDDIVTEILEDVSPFFYWFLALFLTTKFSEIHLAKDVIKIINGIFIVSIVYEIIQIAQSFLEYLLKKWNERQRKKLDDTTLHGVRMIIQILIWVTGILLALSNLGFNISALMASLGIGGIAVALAAQNILSDLFSSFSIYFDKPFQIGDFIIIGEDKGIVKKIGLKTTRIQTLQGEELVIANKELTNARVQNFKKLKRRRINFKLGVTYDTKTAKLKKIPEIIKKIIDKEKLAESDRIHFHEFGDFALLFDIIYFIDSNIYHDYMNAQQSINFKIKEAFEKEKIEMAFPTQTIHVKK